jgi:protein-tyrosine phosphatase
MAPHERLLVQHHPLQSREIQHGRGVLVIDPGRRGHYAAGILPRPPPSSPEALATLLPGAVNFRAVGVDVLAGSAAARAHRCGDLCKVTPATARVLAEELGITTFVDLRSTQEVVELGRPTVLEDAGIRWLHAPISGYSNRAIASGKAGAADYAAYYRAMLDEATPALVSAIEALAGVAAAPFVFGCYTGKDRTGIVAAVLLELVGADREQIRADYALTGPYLQRTAEPWLDKWRKRGLSPAEYAHRFVVYPEVIDLLYAALGHPSLTARLQAGGLHHDACDELRRLRADAS